MFNWLNDMENSAHDAQVIQACQSGRLEEFGKLYDIYFKKIYAFVYFRTRHKEMTEDLTSRIFLKALENIGRFNPARGNFSSWIYRIAHNQVIDCYRARKSELDIDSLWDLKAKDDVARSAETAEKMRLAAKTLKQLTPEQRELVIMRVWDELSYKEIADILGKTEAGCKMAFSRAVAKFRTSDLLILFFVLINFS